MLEKHPIVIAFCSHSWKPFFSDEQAIEFIKEQEEKYGELWSVTIGKLEFNSPYALENTNYQLQDGETLETFNRIKFHVQNRC